ncbi:MAG: sodium:solute symporter family protein [Deltaproteobacteria bacterium]|nr:MAG: sodium:solute symporter family protein [Deltaproteobacteria bacterium]
MAVEHVVVILYLGACVGIGVWASRRSLASADDYWVAGRSVGTWVNAMAIMASLASGGSIIGVMGLAYAQGIPATLALFAGAVVGFPIASVLVARPLRRFGRFTITDFLTERYPHKVVRLLVPTLIILSFTVYIVAQMKAAGITAQVLLGIPYETALTLATLVFVLYVSVGGMLAVTWTDLVQGVLMVAVVLGTAAALVIQVGSPGELLDQAVAVAPALGAAPKHPITTDLGSFVIWAAAVPVIPHVVMRVYTAKNPDSARLSLNIAMLFYSALVLAAVFLIVPFAKAHHPGLEDADQVFLAVMRSEFGPAIRGLAVAAVLAAVMSTTDALLLAVSSAVAHDLIGKGFGARVGPRTLGRVNVVVVWVVGLVAMFLAYDPPALITVFYSAAIGVLGASLLVPVLAGLWWRRANLAGGVAALVVGAVVYLTVQLVPGTPKLSAILFALPASALAMVLGGFFGRPDPAERLAAIAALHQDQDDEGAGTSAPAPVVATEKV